MTRALKISILDILEPKFDDLFKTVKYCLQNVFIAVLKTGLEDWSSLRTCMKTYYKHVNRPVVVKTYIQRPQNQFSKRVEAQAWHIFQNWYST